MSRNVKRHTYTKQALGHTLQGRVVIIPDDVADRPEKYSGRLIPGIDQESGCLMRFKVRDYGELGVVLATR